jgi:predicted esterase
MQVSFTQGFVERTIETQTHGRYLVSAGANSDAAVFLGFHGYGEAAEDHLRRLRAIGGIDHCTVVSIQGLHQFYRRRTNEIVASWMTRQNRELAIADNLEYVTRILRSLNAEVGGRALVVTGFSQGTAMAYRAAVAVAPRVAAVIVSGGDLPPELDAQALKTIPAVLIGRGSRDEWYTAEKMASDEERLRDAGVRVETLTCDTGHEWTPEFGEASLQFLQRFLADDLTL